MEKCPNQSTIVLNMRVFRASVITETGVYVFSWNLREKSSAAKWHEA